MSYVLPFFFVQQYIAIAIGIPTTVIVRMIWPTVETESKKWGGGREKIDYYNRDIVVLI